MKKIIQFSLLTTILFGTFIAGTIGNNNQSAASAITYDPAAGAQYYNDPELYYQGIDPSLTGEDLVEALSTLTSTGFTTHSYSSLPSIYQYSDSSGGGMQMVYTGTVKSFTAGSMPGSTNKEHVWPASWYGTGDREEGAGSPGADAHNVWPAASDLNSKRGSCAFDELDFSSAWKCKEFGTYDYGDSSDNNSFVWSTAFNNSNGQNDDVMYPSEGHRGAIARILMYVATRYHNDTRYPVALHDQATTLKIGRIGKLSTLLKWHYLEPPTEWEINRNNEVAIRWHHNRNPFIDNPEYATLIYQYLPEPDENAPTDEVLNVIETYGNVEYDEPTSISVDSTELSLAVGQEYQFKVSVLPSSAKQMVGYKTSNSSIATVTSAGLVKGISKGDTTIEIYAVDNPDINVKINVSIKELESISISGTPYKTTYYERDIFEPTGLVVTGTFSDGSTTTINNEDCQWLDGVSGETRLSFGTTSIKCIYQGHSANYVGIVVLEKELVGYEKVSMPLSDYSGRYLLVSEEYNKALDGSISLDKKNSDKQIQVAIEDNQILGDYSENEFIITSSGNNQYSLTSSYGQTFGSTSSGDFKAGTYTNTIDIVNGQAIIKCGNLTLRYNANLFRYYSSSNQGDPVYLYQYIDSGEPDINLAEATNFAQGFNAAHICGADNYTKASSTLWLEQQAIFEELSEGAKAILINGIANQYSTNEIENCLARYDRIIYLYGRDETLFPDYMQRNKEKLYANNSFEFVLLNKTSYLVIILLVLSFAAASSFYLINCIYKKK